MLPEPEATVVLGEVAGIRGRLPPAIDADLVDSGLVHILAISGIKVAIVAGLLQLMTAVIAGRRAALGAIAGIGLYTLVGGASASALRSALMGSLGLVARSLRRDSEVLRSLLLAGALMLAWRPSLVADLSFQYSFLGVLGIHLFAEAIGRRLARVPRGIREALAVTAAAQVATVPLTAHYFQVVPLLAPIANAIVLPTLPVSIAGGLLLALVAALARAAGTTSGLAATLFAGLEIPVATLLLWLARLATGVGHLVAHLPGAVLRTPNFGVAPTTGYYAALATAIAARRRWRTPAMAAVAAVVGMAVLLWLGRPDGRLHVSFLGAGGGPAVLVVAPDGAVMLVDTGAQAGALAAALDGALPAALPGPGRRRIDTLLLTGDSHAEAGGLAALDRFRLGSIIAPEQVTGGAAQHALAVAARRGTILVASHPGDRLPWHGVEIDVLPATTQSQALEITYGSARLSLMNAGAGEPAVVAAGDYAVVGVGLGAADPVRDGVRARLVVVQDAAGKPIARGLRQAYGDALWQESRDGRLDLTCDRRRCW
jgi:competence protein ComEC